MPLMKHSHGIPEL